MGGGRGELLIYVLHLYRNFSKLQSIRQIQSVFWLIFNYRKSREENSTPPKDEHPIRKKTRATPLSNLNSNHINDNDRGRVKCMTYFTKMRRCSTGNIKKIIIIIKIAIFARTEKKIKWIGKNHRSFYELIIDSNSGIGTRDQTSKANVLFLWILYILKIAFATAKLTHRELSHIACITTHY